MSKSPFFRIYPDKFRIQLDGGKNSKFEKTIIEDKESPDCANVVFDNGTVGTRPGTSRLNTSAIGAFVIDGLYTRRTDLGAETMVAFAGGSMWQLGNTTFTTVASAQSVFTAGVRVATSQYENHMFMGNGGVTPYKYNGTDFTRHGIYPPTVTATVGSAATGLLTGDYRYKMTAFNSQSVESDVGPATATLTAASATIGLSALQTFSASFGVASRRLYRTVSGGSIFKKVVDIADNTTTTYSDNNADSTLGAAAPTDNGVPPKYSFITYHQNRLFCNDSTNSNFLWFSNLGDPFTFASTNFIRVGDDASDVIKGLGVYDNSVLVFCEKTIWIIYMQSSDPTEWVSVKARSFYGSKSPFAIIPYNNNLFFGAMENDKFVGFASISGNTIDPSSTLLTVSSAGSYLKSDRVEPDMFTILGSQVSNISSIVYKSRLYITVPYGSNATENNRVYYVDFSIEDLSRKNKEAWAPWTGISAAQFTIYGGNLYYGSSLADGFINKVDPQATSDNGTAINSYLWTKEFSGFLNESEYNKDFRFCNAIVDNSGAYFMDIGYRVDSDKGSGNTIQVDLNPGTSLWGTMVWGRDEWGGGAFQAEEIISLGLARGKRIQFKFSNQNKVGQVFKVHGLKVSYNLKGYRRKV